MRLDIEVVYALPERQEVISIKCENGTNIEQAILQSGIIDLFSEIDLSENQIGVHGMKQPLDYELSNFDRVEIYRPLQLSPTEARRLRAKSKSN
ncbi:MAG: RnfH family protein [Gammaproteobacteria bacterium]|nr:RnfH family protein [Gammaproteobacteria bacterium]